MSAHHSTGPDTAENTVRRFAPPPGFAAQARADSSLYAAAAADRLDFWAEQARSRLTWSTKFTKILDWSNPPYATWFADGELNVAYNCADRHVAAGHGERAALLFEGEPGDTAIITYAELTAQIKRAANALLGLGVQCGDRVAIYLPLIPEAIVAMLACARIGAVHSVVFGGFSADALHSRIVDANAKVVITADGGYRRGQANALKPTVDAALALGAPSVSSVLVIRRTGQPIAWISGRDLWWHEALGAAPSEHVAQPMPAEQPLFILYTSGTTGKPKGIVHSSGGYLTQAAFTHEAVFDLHPDRDVYWCTADIGWITGHSYVTYGPLANGATQVIYEGTPDTPTPDRWWQIIAKYNVTKFYTAPTAIRTFMKWGDQLPAAHDLSSLQVLGSVGEPINPEAWLWYREHIGSKNTPIVDTWWQTETGGIMISPLPGVTRTKPGAAQVPLPGVLVDIVDDAGLSVPPGQAGYLVLTAPWPGMLRGIWGDEKRFVETYWSRFPGRYFAGDGAKRDLDGDFWLLGRVDDVMNISGHRLSTAEIESALVAHPAVAEAAVVGASDELTGQAICAFVILRSNASMGPDISAELRTHVSRQIGPIAKPRTILIVEELPKTRSGKIMRRLLRDVAEHRTIGDTTTLADGSVMALIAAGLAAGEAD